MADEIPVETEIPVEVDYSNSVNAKVKQAVLDQYVQTKAYTDQFNATMSQLPSMEHFQEYLKKSVDIGVSPEIALDLYIFTLSMK